MVVNYPLGSAKVTSQQEIMSLVIVRAKLELLTFVVFWLKKPDSISKLKGIQNVFES